MKDNKITGNFIDWNNSVNYVLQWIYESDMARQAYRDLLFRVAMAKEGLPSRNLYQEKMYSNLDYIHDKPKREKFQNLCAKLPVGRSFALANAVDNRANQLAGGVESYECEVDDPFMILDDKVEDRLAAKCAQDYAESGVKYMASQFSDDLTWTGMVAVLVKYCPKTNTNKILRVNPKNTWFDTKYSSTGEERFRGYSTMISYDTLYRMIEEDGDEVNPNLEAPDRSIFDEKGEIKKGVKYSNHHIDTLNGLRIYVEDMNRLAQSSSLYGNFGRDFAEYSHDLNSCYNLGWYRSYATDPEARTKSGYNGDDVELTVIYDLARKIEFKVINRRYVISANSKAFRRKIPYEIINPVTQTVKIEKQEYCLNCPLVFKFERRNMDLKPYPQAPVFPLLDEHDELCALISKRKHVVDIISILRLVANSADASELDDTLNIMGVMLDSIQGDIQTLVYNYNFEPLDFEINRLENEIKTRLKGYDDFDAMQAMGDRASAAESGMATGAIAQGLSTLQQTVMSLYAEIARLCIGNRVTYSKNGNFGVWNGGDYSNITIQEMAALTIIDVKPKLAKKAQERSLAANALALITSVGQTGLVNQDCLAYLLEQAMFGQMPRGLAARFVNKPTVSAETIAANAQQGQNMAQALQQNQMAYESNPMAYEALDVTQSMNPDEVDQAIAMYANQLSAEQGGAPLQESVMPPMEEEVVDESMITDITTPQGVDQVEVEGQEMGMAVDGLPPELAGAMANGNAIM